MNQYGVRFVDDDYKFIDADGYLLQDVNSLTAHFNFYEHRKIGGCNNYPFTTTTIPFNQVKYIELRKENIKE